MPTLGELGNAYVNITANRGSLTKELSKAERQTKKSSNIMENFLTVGFKGASKELGKLGKQMTDIGKNMTFKGALGLGGLAFGINKAMKPIGKLEKELLNVSTLFSDTTFEMSKFKDEIIDMSRQVPKSTSDLTSALYQIVSAGIDSADAMSFLKVSAVSSVAGITSTEVVVRALTKTLQAYGLEADSAQGLSSKLFKTVEKGQINFEEMAQAIPTIAAEASTAGLNLDELMGIFATGTKTLGDFTQVTVGVSGMLNDIGKASDDTKKYAKELGFEFSEQALQSKGLVKFLEDMRDALDENNVSAREFFNRRQSYRLANALLGNSFDDLKESIDAVSDSQGAITTAFNKQMTGLSNKTQLAWNNVVALSKSIGFELIPEFSDLADKVKAAASVLQNRWNNASEETREKIANLVLAVIKGTGAFLGLVTVAGLVSLGLGLILKSAALLMGVLALLTNPIFLVIAAVGLLYTAWENDWLGIRTITENVWETIKPILEDLWDKLNQAWDWMIETGGNAWDWIKDTTWQEKLEDMKGWLTDGWNWTINAIKKGANFLWDLLGEYSPGTQNAIETAWKWTIEKGNELFTWIAEEAWPYIKGTANTAWDWSVNAGNDLFNWIKDTAWPWIKDGATTVWQWTVKGLKNAKPTGDMIIETYLNFGGSTYQAIKKGFETGDWSELFNIGTNVWTAGAMIYLGLDLAKNAGALIMTKIGSLFGNASGALGSAGLPLAIGLLTVGIQLAEAQAEGSFKDFGSNLIVALAAGLGIGAFTGSPATGALAFTVLLNFKVGEKIQSIWSGFESGNTQMPEGEDNRSALEIWFPKLFDFSNWATGGKINGPGTGTSDSIPAMVSNGEYIVNAKSTKKFLPLLAAINSGGKLPGFKDGGGFNLGSIGNMNFDSTLGFLNKASSQLGNTAMKMITFISDLMTKLFKGLIDKLREKYPELAAEFDAFIEDVGSVLDGIKGAFEEDGGGDNDKDTPDEPPTTTIGKIMKSFKDFKEVVDKNKDAMSAMIDTISIFSEETANSLYQLQQAFDFVGNIPKHVDNLKKGFTALRENVSELFGGGKAGQFAGKIAGAYSGYSAFSQSPGGGTNIVGGITGALAGAGMINPLFAVGASLIGGLIDNNPKDEGDKALQQRIKEMNKTLAEWGANFRSKNLSFKDDSNWFESLFGGEDWKTIGKEAAEKGAEIATQIINSMKTTFQTLGGALGDVLFNGMNFEDFSRLIGQRLQQTLLESILTASAIKEPLQKLSALVAEAFTDGFDNIELAKIKNLAKEIFEGMEGYEDIAKLISDEFGLAESAMNGINSALRNVPDGFKRALTTFSSATGVIPSMGASMATAGAYGSNNTMSNINNNSEVNRPIVIENNFHGDIYGMDDFDERVKQSTSKYQTQKDINKYGTRGGN